MKQGLRSVNLMGVLEINPQPAYVAMITKIWDSTSKNGIINKTANIVDKN